MATNRRLTVQLDAAVKERAARSGRTLQDVIREEMGIETIGPSVP